MIGGLTHIAEPWIKLTDNVKVKFTEHDKTFFGEISFNYVVNNKKLWRIEKIYMIL